MRLRLGTRASTLAVTQSTLVADHLRALGHEVELVRIATRGDRERASLTSLAGLGVFAAELRTALLAGECDLAVHSAKDLPVADVPGLAIAAFPEREDPHDALCARDGLTLAELPAGSRVGTGSPRRVAQLRALRPDLEFVDIRGNVDTRLGRVAEGDLDAVVLAASGLARLGLSTRVTELLPVLPAPAQGVLAVECRSDDEAVLTALGPLDHAPSRACAVAERAALEALGGGCAAPIGALGEWTGAEVRLSVGVFSADGASSRVTQAANLDPHEAGRQAADQLIADGAADICDLTGTRDSRLDEFHDAASLWPADRPRPVVFLPRGPGDIGSLLEDAGVRVIAADLLTTTPLDVPESTDVDWVTLTSARTVETLADAGWQPPESAAIAAVGPATAEAAEHVGWHVDLVPPTTSGAIELVAAFPDGPGSVLAPGSALASSVLADGLSEKGWQVETVAVYTVTPVDRLPAGISEAWRQGGVDAVLVTSGSVADAIGDLLGWRGDIRVLAIGAPTAAVLADLGVAAAIAPAQDAQSIAGALIDLMRKGKP